MTPDDYANYVTKKHDRRRLNLTPDASVAIVTYNSGHAIIELLQSLKRQSNLSFEIIIVNNGKTNTAVIEQVCSYPLMYVESNRNSLSLARNIATAYARGNIVIFLDDDCIADENLVAAHMNNYSDPAILGVRGKALSKQHPFYRHFQNHYDLGGTRMSAPLSIPGNSSLRRKALEDVGGFDPDLFGAEELDLCYRIVKKSGDKGSLIYDPSAVIYHDYAKGLFDYLEKSYRHALMRAKLVRKYPHIYEYSRSYGSFPTPQREYASVIEHIAAVLTGRLGMLAEFCGRITAR